MSRVRPFPDMLCALALAASATASLAAPRSDASVLKTEPYKFKLGDGSELAAERGTFSVREDRNDPRSRLIEIGYVRFKSTNPRPGAPIVYLAGGPGGSGLAAARGPRQPIFLALRSIADVIAFDQRGTGLSNHISPCKARNKLDPAVTLTEASLTAHYRQTLSYCAGVWRTAGVAINGYTTEQSADDIEQLRRLLGVTKVDLWGISYGTHLGLAMMRRYPNSVGRAAFSSAEGMDQTVKLPAHLDAVFGRIGAVVQASRASGTYGDLTAIMKRVHARFDAQPKSFKLATPQGGSLVFRMDSFPLRMLASILPKNPDGIGQLAGTYAALDAGQNQALAPTVYGYFFKDPLTMSGMPELMDLASGISDKRLALVRKQASASLAGTAASFPMPQLRGLLPDVDLGGRFRKEIRSNIPVLLFSGDLDIRTPLEEQAQAIAGLADKHQIIVRNGGHDLFEAHPAVPEILAAFFSGRGVAVRELTLPPPTLGQPG